MTVDHLKLLHAMGGKGGTSDFSLDSLNIYIVFLKMSPMTVEQPLCLTLLLAICIYSSHIVIIFLGTLYFYIYLYFVDTFYDCLIFVIILIFNIFFNFTVSIVVIRIRPFCQTNVLWGKKKKFCLI